METTTLVAISISGLLVGFPEEGVWLVIIYLGKASSW